MTGINDGWTTIATAVGLAFFAQPAVAQTAADQSEYFEGLKKVCVYNTPKGRQGMRVPRASPCPRTFRAEADQAEHERPERPVFGMLKHKVKRGSEVFCVYSNGLAPDYVLRKPIGSICQITPY